MTATTGFRMKVSALRMQIRGDIILSTVRHGGNITEHGSGIGFGDKLYLDIKNHRYSQSEIIKMPANFLMDPNALWAKV